MALGICRDSLDFLARFKVSIQVVRCKILIDIYQSYAVEKKEWL